MEITMWGLDLCDSAGAESPCNSLLQGHLGLDSQKTQRRLGKQSPLFGFLQGNWLLSFVPCFRKSQPWREEQRKASPSFQTCNNDRAVHKRPAASGLPRHSTPQGAPGQPPAPFAGARLRKGAGTTPLACTVLCGHLSSPAGSMHLSNHYSH